MYTTRNFKTKKELKAAVKAGEAIRVYQPGGLSKPPNNGWVFLEGPHYPLPHTWYAQAKLENGIVRKVR